MLMTLLAQKNSIRGILRLVPRLSASIALFALLLCLASTSHAATKPTSGGTRTLDTSHSLADGLVGAWLFNENSGSTAADSTSNDNDGTFKESIRDEKGQQLRT